MAISFTPIELGNLANEPTFLANLNANFSELETLLQDCVSRSGEAPNFWEADQDANSYRLYNLAELISTVVRCEELWINGVLFTGEGGSGGVTDHGDLDGLDDDDHTQYHNDTRGDLRYYLKSEVYTQDEITALLGAFQTYVDDNDGAITQQIIDLETSDLADVSSATPTVGQILRWDGSEYVPSDESTGGGTQLTRFETVGVPFAGIAHSVYPYGTGFIVTRNNGPHNWYFPGPGQTPIQIPSPTGASTTIEWLAEGESGRIIVSCDISPFIYYTDDLGQNWTSPATNPGDEVYGATDGNGNFLIVRKNAGNRWYSDDNCTTLTAMSGSSGLHGNYNATLCYSEGRDQFIAQTSSRLYTVDIGTWTITEIVKQVVYPEAGNKGAVCSYGTDILYVSDERQFYRGPDLNSLVTLDSPTRS